MKNLILIIAVLFQTVIAFGSTPNWVVNSSDYEYSLTITAVVEVDGQLIGATDDMVGTFVDGECRGVANAVFNSTYNKYFFFITVFSNQYSGENISFKYYNKVNDSIYIDFATIEFEDGTNLGTASSPYIIAKTVNKYDITISSDTIIENSSVGTFIGTVAVNYNADDLSFTIKRDTLFTDWEYFLLRNDSIFSTEIFNYEEQDSYNLGFEVISSAKDTSKSIIEIVIIDEKEISALLLSNMFVNESSITPTFIGILSVESKNDRNYLYNISDSFDSDAFYLIADSLYTDSVFNYQIKDKYTIEVKAYSDYDTVLNTFTIEVVNQLVYGEVQLVNNEINENQGKNTFISKLTVTGMDTTTVGYQFYVENFNNDIFYIQNDSLFVSESLNYEEQKEYALTFYFIENANYDTTKTFAIINVLDTNDAPYNMIISNDTISENMPIGTFVAKISIDDDDINDSIIFKQAIPIGDFMQVFEIRGDSIFTISVLDFETSKQHSIMIIATDKANAQINGFFKIKVNNIVESSIFDKKEALELNIYPNPVRDILTIKTSNNINNTTIYNVLGKVVYNSGLDVKIVDISTLQKGVYFIEVSVSNKRYITQFIKE